MILNACRPWTSIAAIASAMTASGSVAIRHSSTGAIERSRSGYARTHAARYSTSLDSAASTWRSAQSIPA